MSLAEIRSQFIAKKIQEFKDRRPAPPVQPSPPVPPVVARQPVDGHPADNIASDEEPEIPDEKPDLDFNFEVIQLACSH